MSADNYYTVKLHPQTLQWHVCHGFMSGLEDDIPALIREGSTPYADYADAAAAAFDMGYSEYGVINEGDPCAYVSTQAQWREFLTRKLELYASHLAWLDRDLEVFA